MKTTLKTAALCLILIFSLTFLFACDELVTDDETSSKVETTSSAPAETSSEPEESSSEPEESSSAPEEPSEPEHTHTFDKEVATDAYLATPATHKTAATYY